MKQPNDQIPIEKIYGEKNVKSSNFESCIWGTSCVTLGKSFKLLKWISLTSEIESQDQSHNIIEEVRSENIFSKMTQGSFLSWSVILCEYVVDFNLLCITWVLFAGHIRMFSWMLTAYLHLVSQISKKSSCLTCFLIWLRKHILVADVVLRMF